MKLAVRHYNVAAELRPEASWIFRKLGSAHASLEQWDQAVQAYRKALALAPDDPELRADAAVAQQRSGRAEEAATLSQATLKDTRLKSAVSAEMAGKLNAETAK